MKKIITCIFVFLCYIPLCNLYAQQEGCFSEKYVHKNLLNVNNPIIYSLCDSLVNHSKKCLLSPSWFKLKFNKSDEDSSELSIWCVLVQFLDSAYYCMNKEWLIGSEFTISPYSIGVFFYKDLRFEVISSASFPIEQYLTKSDSLVQLHLWDSSARTVMMPIRTTKFPEYFQMLWGINLLKNEIIVSQEICSCIKSKARKKHRMSASPAMSEEAGWKK